MCLPKSPNIAAPVPPQEVKLPNADALRKKGKPPGSGMAGGTLLTGPSGIANASLSTGTNTLLGG